MSSKLPHNRSVVKRADRPRRAEQVATLHATLHDPCAPADRLAAGTGAIAATVLAVQILPTLGAEVWR